MNQISDKENSEFYHYLRGTQQRFQPRFKSFIKIQKDLFTFLYL